MGSRLHRNCNGPPGAAVSLEPRTSYLTHLPAMSERPAIEIRSGHGRRSMTSQVRPGMTLHSPMASGAVCAGSNPAGGAQSDLQERSFCQPKQTAAGRFAYAI